MAVHELNGYAWERHDPARKEALIQAFMPLIKKMAGKLSLALPPSLEESDLVGSGVIGLLEAWDRYDPARKVDFTAFAASRIRGAMIDELRKVSLAPRSFFPRLRQLHEAEAKLRQELQREPMPEEIARLLGWTEALLNQVWACYNLLAVISLEKLLFESEDGDSLRLAEVLEAGWGDPEKTLVEKEKLSRLARALDSLPPREKTLLALYYYEDLTQKEIASLLQVSTVRVSQLHGRALLRMRELLQAGQTCQAGVAG